MYWASPLIARAVTLGLVEPRRLARLERKVRRRNRDVPACDWIWAEELVRAGAITRYQAQALLSEQAPARQTNPLPGSRCPLAIGPFLVLDRAGQSDLGETFHCRLRGTQQSCAVKLLDARLCTSERVQTRIADETAAWAKLADPRVLAVERIERVGDSIALVSRWVPARSLAELLRGQRRLAPHAVASLARELIGLLAAADAHGLVHGDLKPSNVLIDGRGTVLLTDCGIRRSVEAAGLLVSRGLPPERYDYVAPEVASGQAPDAASDIYALGCLVHHLLCGRPPFLGGNAHRKSAAHAAGRLADPARFGVELPAELRRILDATIQADRARRIETYSELLGQLSPMPLGRRRRFSSVSLSASTRGAAHCSTSNAPAASAYGKSPLAAATVHGGKWLLGAAALAAAVLGLVHTSQRMLPILSVPSVARRPAVTREPAAGKQSLKPTRLARRGQGLATVTGLWNATDDLRRAYQEAPPHGTITLQSPGPFLLDAIEIDKPITLRGAPDLRPLFLGGPGSALRVSAAGVRLENLHFLRLADTLRGQSMGAAGAMLEVTGGRASVVDCSFQDSSGSSTLTAAIQWRPEATYGQAEPATLDARNLLFRQVAAGVLARAPGPIRLALDNCMHLGPGPLADSASSTGKPLDTIELGMTGVTVYGSGTVVHSFPAAIDAALPIAITSRSSHLVPRSAEQPVLEVRYESQPSTLMPKVSWSGSATLAPADATLLEVRRGPDAPPWRAVGLAAWKAYWGSRPTGLLGVRVDFAAEPVLDPMRVPRLQIEPATASPLGADPALLHAPPAVALEQLPLLIQRLAAE